MFRNFQRDFQVYRDELYLRLEQEALCEVLDSDDLNVENEMVVFDSVQQWLIINQRNDDTHLLSLLKVVRLSLLPIEVVDTFLIMIQLI